MKKGGAAKGELVLAMFELANSFRRGWGVKKDPSAARQYYETAANLGDTDAMNEAAWCYVEGFGCKKDKVSHPSTRHHFWQHRGCERKKFMSCASHISLASCTGISLRQPHLLGTDGRSRGADWIRSYLQFKAAQFLRLAEEKGNKTIGNTW